MFILIKGPISKSDLTVPHGDDAYFALDMETQKIKSALINVNEIAGITEMQDGGLWIVPVNRDPARIKPEEYYIKPGEAHALLDALTPYIVNPDENEDTDG